MIATAPPTHSVTSCPVISIMDAARVRSLGTVNSEKSLHFAQDAVERAGLEAAVRFHDIAMHRIAAPHHLVAFALYRPAPASASRPRPCRGQKRLISVMRPASRAGFNSSSSLISASPFEARPALHAERIADPAPANSIWAEPGEKRVRSPIHSMCAAGRVPNPRSANRAASFACS